MDATGPSAVAFWPSSVTRLIGAYQARLEETRTPAAEEAYALVWAIGTIAVAASIVKHYPVVSASGDHRLTGAVTLAVFLCAAEIALWLGIARACPGAAAAGPGSAGTVLFALHTAGALGVVASRQAGLGPAKVLTLIGWLIGLGAVLALWQRPSSAFFNARAPVSR